MPQATFTLSIPETIWIGELSRSHPDAVFRVLAAIPNDETGAGLVEIRHDDVESIVEAFRSYDSVTSVEIMHRGDGQVLLQFETDVPLLLFAMQESGVPIQTPFELVDGTVTLDITAAQSRLSELTEQLERFGISFSVDRLQQQLGSERLLTEKQAALVEEALERGYYDTPRDCTLVELAECLDMAPSTVSETLHRAEERIIKSVVGTDEGSTDSG
ncbi:MAG: helix-turn-helix domain-containing protein [Natronomonas sp.]